MWWGWGWESSRAPGAGVQDVLQTGFPCVLHSGQDGPWGQAAWVQILALPFPDCVTLGKSLNFSVPVSSHVKWVIAKTI